MREKISEYIAQLRLQGISQNTVVSYQRDLYKMADFLEEKKKEMNLLESFDWDQIDGKQLQDYLRQMEHEKKRPSTIARSVASIKSFFRYLEQNGSLSQNPAAQLKAPKVEKEIPYILTPQEVVRLLKQPQGNSPKAIRDRAMLEMLYATGIRVSELVKIQAEDINLTMEYLLCRQGMKERVIPFCMDGNDGK